MISLKANTKSPEVYLWEFATRRLGFEPKPWTRLVFLPASSDQMISPSWALYDARGSVTVYFTSSEQDHTWLADNGLKSILVGGPVLSSDRKTALRQLVEWAREAQKIEWYLNKLRAMYR